MNVETNERVSSQNSQDEMLLLKPCVLQQEVQQPWKDSCYFLNIYSDERRDLRVQDGSGGKVIGSYMWVAHLKDSPMKRVTIRSPSYSSTWIFHYSEMTIMRRYGCFVLSGGMNLTELTCWVWCVMSMDVLVPFSLIQSVLCWRGFMFSWFANTALRFEPKHFERKWTVMMETLMLFKKYLCLMPFVL